MCQLAFVLTPSDRVSRCLASTASACLFLAGMAIVVAVLV